MTESIVLLVSLACNLRCPYCFAENTMGQRGFMRFSSFARAVNFFSRRGRASKRVKIRLAGGEPTLHPEFRRMLAFLRKRPSVDVQILTNGLFGRDALGEMLAFDRSRLSFLINVNDPQRIGRRRFSLIEKNIRALSSYRVTVGINFYSPKNRYGYIIDLARKYGLKIRWSLTHPVGGEHLYVRPEDFKGIKSTVLKFLKKCNDMHIPTSPDCSTPLCLFEGAVGFIPEAGPGSFFCHPPIVIDPGLNVSLCYEAATSKLGDFRKPSSLFRRFDRLRQRRGVHFWLPDCRICHYRDYRKCGGGCPHHSQQANDVDLKSCSERDLKSLGFHFSERYREYSFPGRSFCLKDISGRGGCIELDKFMYDLAKICRTKNNRTLALLYRELKKIYKSLDAREFVDIVDSLVRDGYMNVWRA